MWRIVTVLGLLCGMGSAAAAGPADYRFEALVDRDQSATTGCDAASPAGTLHGMELRIYAETDRTRILRVVAEQCESGAWREIGSATDATPLGLGQGTLGSDAIAFDIRRSWLGDAQAVDVQLFGQAIATGAFDFIGADDGSTRLQIALGGSAAPVPVIGAVAWVLFVCGVVLIARHHPVALRRRAMLPLLALLGFGAFAIAPVKDSRADRLGLPLVIADPANDSVGNDAGVDFVGASITDNGAGLAVRLDVNNIEADGLADDSKILFIGNSLTYVNDLPAMLTAVAAQAGKTLTTAQVTEGGFALEDHFREGRAQAEIAKGYQLVILQQGPSALKSSQVNLLQWAENFNPLIRDSGARPALYMVWPELARFDVFDDVRDSYSNAALAIDAMFIPGGEAWRASWRIDPALALYGPDNFHPSTLGTYAIAATMFAEIFRQTPVDLPPTFSLANGMQIVLDAAQARAVQQGAWQAHLEFGRAGN